MKAEDLYLRKPEFLSARDIELWTEKEVQQQLRSVLSGWLCSCHGEGKPTLPGIVLHFQNVGLCLGTRYLL